MTDQMTSTYRYLQADGARAPRRPSHDPETGMAYNQKLVISHRSHLTLSQSWPNSAAAFAVGKSVGLSTYYRVGDSDFIIPVKLYLRAKDEAEAEAYAAEVMAAQEAGNLVNFSPIPPVYDEDGKMTDETRDIVVTNWRIFSRKDKDTGEIVESVEFIANGAVTTIRAFLVPMNGNGNGQRRGNRQHRNGRATVGSQLPGETREQLRAMAAQQAEEAELPL